MAAAARPCGAGAGRMRREQRPGRAARRAARARRARACGAADAAALPARLRAIVGSFQAVPDPMQRYNGYLLRNQLAPLDDAAHRRQQGQGLRVPGAGGGAAGYGDGHMLYEAGSDSQLTKGLAALLVEGLSGATPDEVAAVQPDFVEELGLEPHALSQQRVSEHARAHPGQDRGARRESPRAQRRARTPSQLRAPPG